MPEERFVEGVPMSLWEDIVDILEAFDYGFHVNSETVRRVMQGIRELDEKPL